MSLKAIIFDLDGLMVDSEPLSRQAWEEVLGEYGRNLSDNVYHQLIGLRLEDSARLIQEGLALPVAAAELARQKEEAWVQIWTKGVPAMPGLHELHEEIRRLGLPWAVATSSRRAYAEAILTQLGLRQRCTAIAAGNEVAHGKPAPDLYLLAAERLNITPARCLALEDSVPGCQAAVAAGMVVAAVPGGHNTAADFGFAHYVFDSLADVAGRLSEILDGSYT
jgi:HAD superfamily hydrolase (TIGR01509 family)